MEKRKEQNLTAYIFLIPALVLFALFNVIPIVYSFYLSMIKWDGFSAHKKFVGLKNYIAIFSNTAFYNSLYITVTYTILVTLGSIVISMLLASPLNRELKFKTLFRTAYFIPVITATAAAGVVWRYMLDPSQGIVNKFLNYMQVPSVPWLTSPFWVLISISLVGIWKRVGYNMVIYLAAMQSISSSLYESADIDGATKFQKFSKITVPLLKPTTLLLIIMCFIDSFQVFDQVYIMTNGGPMGASDVLGLYMYREGFASGNIGYASAVGWVIFLIVFIATIVQLKISDKGGED